MQRERITLMDRLRAIALLWRKAWARRFRRDPVVPLNVRELPLGGDDAYRDMLKRRAVNEARAAAIVDRARAKSARTRPSIFEAGDGRKYRRVNASGTLRRDDAGRARGKAAVKAAKRHRQRVTK